MSLDKKSNIALIVTLLGYGLLIATAVLGILFPGNSGPDRVPWYVWAMLVEIVALGVTAFAVCLAVRKKDRQRKSRTDEEFRRSKNTEALENTVFSYFGRCIY